ncbi:ABC transporter ATP-binding protein [Microbacterium sp. X-17]|uniref:ABC transporter ATP-binding protein n=1 Tax=Microbacterium sp. X-17 TaxID=3144404 RepID=UPI0031F51D36
MTVAVPPPDEPDPLEPDEVGDGRASVTPRPAGSAARKPAPRARARRAPRRATSRGPRPPQVPDHLVIPPKPPLPVPLPEAEAEVEPEEAAEVDAPTEVDAATEVEVAGAEVQVEAVVEPEAAAIAEPAVEAPVEVDVVENDVVESEAEVVALVAEVVEVAEPDVWEADGAVADVVEPAFVAVQVAEAAAPQPEAIVVRGLTKLYGGVRAVDGIDLTVPAGSFYGLVGPNGAGKTTTLSVISGLLTPDAGSLHVGGVDAMARPREAKRLIGVLPDRLRTFDRLSGRQLLYYCGVLRGLDASVVESRSADLARAFDLVDALGRPVSDYSAGMTKKIMLAGAMIHSPRVLVLDEPFEAVDPVSSSVILDILTAYVEHGGTVVLSSHGIDLVERVCRTVAVLVSGRVLAEGSVDDVRGELTLEERYVELAGGSGEVEGLEWLHTFSG